MSDNAELVKYLRSGDDVAPLYADQAADAITALEARVAALGEQLHYATGVCDLAMAHRDTAEARVAALEADKKRQFNAGYVIACCNISDLHGDEPAAFDVLSELGITRAEVKALGLSEYDGKALREIESSRSASPYAPREGTDR